MNLQLLQLEAMNRNRKEASDGRGAGILKTPGFEEKILQSRQSHSEHGDIVVVQFEGAFAIVLVPAAGVYIQVDQVLKYLDRGGEGNVDNGNRKVFDDEVF